MALEYMHGAHGSFPELRRYTAGGAIAKGVGVALNAGKLVIATADTNVALIGIAEEAASKDGDVINVVPLLPDAVIKVPKTGTATPAVGGKYDLAANGLSINADDVTNPKVKVIAALDPLPGETAVSRWLAVNISFGL